MADEMYHDPKTPWWVNAPAGLAAGIVGVPSLIALLCLGYVLYVQPKILEKAASQLATGIESNRVLIQHSTEIQQGWIEERRKTAEQAETVERHLEMQNLQLLDFMALQVRMDEQNCINSAKSPYQTQQCVAIRNSLKEEAR